MLTNSHVMTFVATADADKSRAFYEGILGLKLAEDDMFALVFDLNGTMLRIQKVEQVAVAPYTALGWKVDDITAEVRELSGRGARFERFEGMGQDELGIWPAPGGAKVAWFKDPDGNTLSLTQF